MTRPATGGIVASPAETLLTERARDFLAAGPSRAVPLIEHICQLPGAPPVVAEQMALALFADRTEFVRNAAGEWCLAASVGAVRCVREAAPAWSDGESGDAPAPREPPAPADVRARSGEPPVRDELAGLSYVVVDVETTGTRPWAGDRITEVAAIVVRDGEVAERFETLVNPERPIPPMISALTHISWEMVKHAPRFRDICDDLLGVLGGHVFVAHNAEFDWGFVSAEVARACGRRLSGRRLCTVRLARRVLPQLRSRRLDSVANYYNVEIPARHRAGGDAIATARILLRLLDAARERECRSWTDLERLIGTASPRRARRAPAMPHPVNKDTTA